MAGARCGDPLRCATRLTPCHAPGTCGTVSVQGPSRAGGKPSGRKRRAGVGRDHGSKGRVARAARWTESARPGSWRESAKASKSGGESRRPRGCGRRRYLALPLGVLTLRSRLFALSAALSLSALAVGCGGGQEPSASPPSKPATNTPVAETSTPIFTATATAVPTRTPPVSKTCPVAQGACDAAAAIESAIRTGDVDYLLSRAHFRPFTCPVVRPSGKGGPYPLCDDDMGRGQELPGFPVWNDVTRLIYNRSSLIGDFAQMVDTSTRGGDWRVRTIACRLDALAPLVECSPSLVVFGYVNDGQLVSSTNVQLFELQSLERPETGFLIDNLTGAFAIRRRDTDILLGGGTLSQEPAHSSLFGFGPFHRWNAP